MKWFRKIFKNKRDKLYELEAELDYLKRIQLDNLDKLKKFYHQDDLVIKLQYENQFLEEKILSINCEILKIKNKK